MSDKEPVSEENKPSKAEAIAKIKGIQAELARQEALQGPSGAAPAATPRMLLDASDVQAMNPDKRVRWVNVNNQQKAATRQAQGYERIPLSEGGRQVGNLALFRIPKEQYDQRVAEIKKRSEERLSAHNKEVEGMAEQVSKILRDKHGMKVSAERILISDKE